jgi:hypothetical protein
LILWQFLLFASRFEWLPSLLLVSLKEKVAALYPKVCWTWFHFLAVKSGVAAFQARLFGFGHEVLYGLTAEAG